MHDQAQVCVWLHVKNVFVHGHPCVCGTVIIIGDTAVFL